MNADRQVSRGSDEPDWPTLVPLDNTATLPAFPLHALPPELAEWASATAVATQVPVDLPALLALAVVSTLCAKRFELEVRPGWVEPLNIYVAIAMDPGERKSAVFRSAIAPILMHERTVGGEMAAEIAAANTKREIRDREYKRALDVAAKSGDPSDAQVAQELGIELAATRSPVVPRHFADDVTPEQLAILLSQYGGRMGVFSSEGGIFDTLAGRYSDGIANLDLVLKAHSGDHFRVDRIKREPVQIASPALTVALTVQPTIISGLTQRADFRGRGLLGRFLYSMPRSLVGFRDQCPPPVEPRVHANYEGLLLRLVGGEARRDEAGEIQPETLSLVPETLELFTAAGAELEPKLAPGGELECIRDLATKHVGLLARIAGLLHLANSENGIPGAVGIPVSIGEKSLLLSDYLLSHALAAYQLMGADPAIGGAKKVLAWAQRAGLAVFSKRDAWQACKGFFKEARDLDAPLQTLVEHGYLQALEPPKRTGPGAPPSPRFALNPCARNPHNPRKGR